MGPHSDAECRMEGTHRELDVLFINDTGDFDLRRADHEDIHSFLRQGSEHLRSNSEWDRIPTPNAVWRERIASSTYFSSMTQEILISDVLIMRIFTPSCAMASNIFAATPEWDRIPTPTSETFAIASVTATDFASTPFATS